MAGLEQTVSKQLTIGITEALGVESPDDDISERILELPDGGKEMLDKYCLPRIRESCMRDINDFILDEVQTVHEANSKYAEDPTTFTGSYGSEEHFFQGLDEFNGCPDGSNVEMQMKKEFQDTSAFTTSNYGGIKTDLKTEWEFIVAPHPDSTYPGEQGLTKADGTRHPGRVRNSLEHYMKLDITLRAGLVRVEVIALRLYTGPAYMWLNKVLRAGGRAAAKPGACNFPATISALNSAIKKLARVTPLPATRKLYRGLAGMALPAEVLVRKHFVELAFSSATTDKAVALSYAGCDRASVFEIELGYIDRGADISAFSQYPEEREHVIPPLSHFEIAKVCAV